MSEADQKYVEQTIKKFKELENRDLISESFVVGFSVFK